MVISPAWALGEPIFSPIPANSSLVSATNKFWVLTLIKPPPAARTSTAAFLVNSTLLLATASGKLKLPVSLIPISPAADNPPNSTNPPGAVIKPPANLISPPIKAKVSPAETCKPTSLARD